jgi:hypothetical protein
LFPMPIKPLELNFERREHRENTVAGRCGMDI